MFCSFCNKTINLWQNGLQELASSGYSFSKVVVVLVSLVDVLMFEQNWC
jgi:hypothetical protein